MHAGPEQAGRCGPQCEDDIGSVFCWRKWLWRRKWLWERNQSYYGEVGGAIACGAGVRGVNSVLTVTISYGSSEVHYPAAPLVLGEEPTVLRTSICPEPWCQNVRAVSNCPIEKPQAFSRSRSLVQEVTGGFCEKPLHPNWGSLEQCSNLRCLAGRSL